MAKQTFPLDAVRWPTTMKNRPPLFTQWKPKARATEFPKLPRKRTASAVALQKHMWQIWHPEEKE